MIPACAISTKILGKVAGLEKAFTEYKTADAAAGQNLLAYRQYPDDVVDTFVAKSVENGIDIIRIFDALNDTRNLERAIKAAKKLEPMPKRRWFILSVLYTIFRVMLKQPRS